MSTSPHEEYQEMLQSLSFQYFQGILEKSHKGGRFSQFWDEEATPVAYQEFQLGWSRAYPTVWYVIHN